MSEWRLQGQGHAEGVIPQDSPKTLLGGSWDLVNEVVSTSNWGYKYSYPNYNPSYYKSHDP